MTDDPFALHRSLLFTVAYEMLGSASDAEDVVQETWLRWAKVDVEQVRAANPNIIYARGSAYGDKDPQRDIGAAARQVDQFVRKRQAHGDIGVTHLEPADPRTEPAAPDCHGRGDRKDVSIVAAQAVEGLGNSGKAAGQSREQALSAVGQAYPALLPHEKLVAHAIFKLPDLVADRRLGHAEFFRGAGEILVPSGSLEGANGGKRGQLAHANSISQVYTYPHPFCWHTSIKRRTCSSSIEENEDARRTHIAEMGRDP